MSGANRSSYNRIMNNEISNKPCGCGNCEPMCTTCGRPWIVCKGECGCKDSCCCNKKVNFCEYGRMAHGCIRERTPECPMQAVIPSVVVDSISNLKNLADCFAHVTSINTTFYIDDKHRTMITWAGPVEYDNYDLAANSLGLRSQFLLDFANNRGAYYNKTGNYQVFNFGNGGGEETARYEIAASNLSSVSTFGSRNWSFDGLDIVAYSAGSVVITKDGSAVSPADLLGAGDSLLKAIFSFDVIAVKSVGGGEFDEITMHVSATPTSVVNSGGGLKISGTYCLDETQWTEEPGSMTEPPLRFSLGIGSNDIWFQFETFEDLV